MKIIIAGAGDVGFHLAALLSRESQDIYLIDSDREKLEYAASHQDVFTIAGNCTSLEVLEQANASSADLVIAVTDREATNVLCGALAKSLGAKTTIARVQNQEFLPHSGRYDLAQLGIDSAISPRELMIREIQRLLKQSVATDLFEFENGALSVFGIVLGEGSPLLAGKAGRALLAENSSIFRPIAIQRRQRTLIPHKGTTLEKDDHLYFLTRPEGIELISGYSGSPTDPLRDVMILGGGKTGELCARALQDEHRIKLIEKDRKRCEELAGKLPKVMVVHADARDVDVLEEEGLNQVDAFVSLTGDPETNIISCLVAKNHGVRKAIALVENVDYISITQNIGIDILINRKLIAANNIFRYVRGGWIDAITSLHGVDAEIIEFSVAPGSRITKKAIGDQKIPKGALIGGVIRGEETFFGRADLKVRAGDHVVVFCLPQTISQIEKLFSV